MAIRPMEPSGQCESELAAAGVALPELLAPAGGLDQMLAAIAAGADAIYAGLDGFNARVSAHGFNDDEFVRGCAVAHAHGVRVYVTLNVFVFDDELADAVALGAHAHALGADALIVADAGLACALRAAIPGVEIHLSTQAGAHSEGAVRLAAKELGVERVTTARELSVAEIGTLACPSRCSVTALFALDTRVRVSFRPCGADGRRCAATAHSRAVCPMIWWTRRGRVLSLPKGTACFVRVTIWVSRICPSLLPPAWHRSRSRVA